MGGRGSIGFRAILRKPKKSIFLILSLACLGVFAAANVQAADVRVLVAGGDLIGNQASNEIYANGDLTCSVSRPPRASIVY